MSNQLTTQFFNYNPFEDIQLNRVTIWQITDFETSLPPLMTTEYNECHINEDSSESLETICSNTNDIKQTDQLIETYMKTFNQSVVSLDDIKEPNNSSDDQIYDTFASGDCQDLWQMAAQPQTTAQNKTNTKTNKTKDKRFRVNSLHLKSNLIRFPEKLWTIINECKTGAIKWSADGQSILINYFLFKDNYLKDFKHFKTKNISSFVRQLNLYGFHKLGLKTKKKTNYYKSAPISFNNFALSGQNIILSQGLATTVDNTDLESNEWHEFKSQHFVRDQKELLEHIQRKYPNQTNDENVNQLPQKKPKSGRKPFKHLKSNQIKPMIKKSRKQTFDSQFGYKDKQSTNSLSIYSNDLIFFQNCSKMSDNLLDNMTDSKPYDPLFH